MFDCILARTVFELKGVNKTISVNNWIRLKFPRFAIFLRISVINKFASEPTMSFSNGVMSKEFETVGKLAENFDLTNCEKLAEGKTKIILSFPNLPGYVIVQSKDKLTAFNAQRKHDLEGKAKLSNLTTCKVFEYLKHVGFNSHFVKTISDTEFVARRCEMIPIEWVTRRIATGSFLKRNEGVKEGFRFSPPKLELFFKDDAKGDPQWSEEMLLESKMCIGGLTIGRQECTLMSRASVLVFECLERAWASLGCSLIDMKVEYGVIPETGEIVLADVIDSDSWRLWPGGDKRLQLDKQFYRDLPEVKPEDLAALKEKFAVVIEKLDKFIIPSKGRVVILMGSVSDKDHCLKIKKSCDELSVPCFIRVTSAHKDPRETLRIASEYEGDGVPTVFIAVAGRSNGLGPVLSGNVTSPVINCPPASGDFGTADIWSSLRLPSGLTCSTVLQPENAAWAAASILALQDHCVWSRLHVKQFLNSASLLKANDDLMKSLDS